ncbi:MAG: hypothetical protein LBB79_10290 [Prevotellaceae bacterium]|jgi:hypothetical protein|nr:hypothetical protein [Prevotellaceae bacterium]
MWDKLAELYPKEGICFTSDDAQNAEQTFTGEAYPQPPSPEPNPVRRRTPARKAGAF